MSRRSRALVVQSVMDCIQIIRASVSVNVIT